MKKFKQTMLAGVMASLVCGVAIAGEVGSMTTFTSGTPAQASQVNGNFQALTTAVNDNNSRIEALEAALAVNNSVSGRYYKLRDMGWIMAAERVGDTEAPGLPDGSASVNNGFSRVGFYVGNIDMHFDANGTFTIDGEDIDVEMFTSIDSDIGLEINPASGSGAWVQQGNVLSLTFEGESEAMQFTVSKGGLVLTSGDAELREIWTSESNIHIHEYEGSLIIAVEVDAPQP